MRKILTKAVAVTATLSLAFAVVANVNTATKAETGDAVALTKWSFYQGGTSFRNQDDQWAQRFYNSVTVGTEIISGWGSADAQTPETTKTASVVADNFTADIATTGWDGDYKTRDENDKCGDNNPYMLRASMKGIQIITGHKYKFSFDASWTRTNDKAPEKNIQVAINNSDESVFANDTTAVTKLKVTNGSSASYSQDFTVWSGDGTLSVEIAYGAFLYDLNHGLTTEDVSAAGILEIKNVKLVDLGENPDYVPPVTPWIPADKTTAPAAQTTTAPVTTQAPTQVATTPVVNKVFAKVTGVKAKAKKGKITVTWKKVTGAKKYQVKVGKKSYTAKSTKYVVKKGLKKGKTVKVQVRALAANGYKAGAFSKTVKVKVK